MVHDEIQWINLKESTKDLVVKRKPQLNNSEKVLNIGCGAGAVTACLDILFPEVKFSEIDKESLLIRLRFALDTSSVFLMENLNFAK